MLCLERSVKGGFILRTQQAKGLQISIEDKTGGGEVLPVRCGSSVVYFDACQLLCVCKGGAPCPKTQLFKNAVFLKNYYQEK